jgi:NitT/TauT family transport system substrate-binding protein
MGWDGARRFPGWRRALACAVASLSLVAAGCGAGAGSPAPAAGAKGSSAAAPAAPAPSSSTSASTPASASASATGSGASSGGSSCTSPFPLTVGYSVISATQSPLWAAMQGGYLKAACLKVDSLVKAGPGGLVDVEGGHLDILETAASVALEAAAQGRGIVWLGTFSQRLDQQMMVKSTRTDITSIADMKGKRVGVTIPGSISYTSAILVATQAHLTPGKDFILVPFQDLTTIMSALGTGAIDIGFLDPPTSLLGAKQYGLKAVYNLTNLKLRYAATGFATTLSFAQAHPAQIAAFEHAINAAIARLKSDPTFADAVLRHYFKMNDPTVIQETAKDVLPTIEPLGSDVTALNTTKKFTLEAVPSLAKVLTPFPACKVLLSPPAGCA